MTISFENEVVLVAGAGSGIGLATAKAFVEAGASLALADRDEKSARVAVDELATGHSTLAVRCNVRDEKQAAAIVEQVVFKFGWLNAACNNDFVTVLEARRGSEVARNAKGALEMEWNTDM